MNDTLTLVCLFLRREIPEMFRKWSDRRLMEWVQWSLDTRRMAVIYDGGPDSEVIGVGAARCLSAGMDDEDWYVHDEMGDTIFVDVAVGSQAVPTLWLAMKTRYGLRKQVSFRRLTGNKRRTFDAATFERHLYGKFRTSTAAAA